MWRAGLLIAAICTAGTAAAQCQPSGRATFAAGVEALDRGDLGAAAASFEALVKAQPDCAEARNNLAVVLVEQGRLPEAAEHLRRAVAVQPDYRRARLNLARVELLLAPHPEPPPAAALPAGREPLHAPAPTPPAPAPTPAPTPTVARHPVPPCLAALEPEGATAAVIDLPHNQICVYRRAADRILQAACYAMLAHAGVQPGWLTASDLTRRRIRLVDDTGRRRLKIVDNHAAAEAGVVRLGTADFFALSAQVVPWRTAWVVQAAAPAAPPDSAARAGEVRAALERWRQAWEAQQLDAYTAMYGAAFAPQDDPSVAYWRARKRRLFEQPGAIRVHLEAPSLFVLDAGTAIATFEQHYRSDTLASVAVKALRWQREGAGWTITAETVLHETPAAPAGG